MKPSFQLAAVACALSLALAGCSQSTPSTSSTESVQQSQTVKQYDAETFFDTTSIMGSSFSPKGDKILVSSDESGIYSLYEVDIKTVQKTRLTDFEDSTYAVAYFPKD
ncbi:MAG: S9 family peptidase, partial [Pseudoalteromonas sp.]|nr:S9 family peptidase [Pseudoalteromonas sp.]